MTSTHDSPPDACQPPPETDAADEDAEWGGWESLIYDGLRLLEQSGEPGDAFNPCCPGGSSGNRLLGKHEPPGPVADDGMDIEAVLDMALAGPTGW